jgi:hypothetical protein
MMPTRFDLNQEQALPLYYGIHIWNPNARSTMVWLIRILLTLPAALGARLVGYDLLDFGFVGTAVVFVIIIGFAVWATERTIRHDP